MADEKQRPPALGTLDWWVGYEAAPDNVVQTGIRERMVALAKQSDADVYEALRSHLQEIIDG